MPISCSCQSYVHVMLKTIWSSKLLYHSIVLHVNKQTSNSFFSYLDDTQVKLAAWRWRGLNSGADYFIRFMHSRSQVTCNLLSAWAHLQEAWTANFDTAGTQFFCLWGYEHIVAEYMFAHVAKRVGRAVEINWVVGMREQHVNHRTSFSSNSESQAFCAVSTGWVLEKTIRWEFSSLEVGTCWVCCSIAVLCPNRIIFLS